MATYEASVVWQRGADEDFTDQRYSRRHRWLFDGGADIPASSSPHSVRVPFSDPMAVDPEEALVAALSSCHMLFFLWFAELHHVAHEACYIANSVKSEIVISGTAHGLMS